MEIWFFGMILPVFVALLEYGYILVQIKHRLKNGVKQFQDKEEEEDQRIKNLDKWSFYILALFFVFLCMSALIVSFLFILLFIA